MSSTVPGRRRVLTRTSQVSSSTFTCSAHWFDDDMGGNEFASPHSKRTRAIICSGVAAAVNLVDVEKEAVHGGLGCLLLLGGGAELRLHEFLGVILVVYGVQPVGQPLLFRFVLRSNPSTFELVALAAICS